MKVDRVDFIGSFDAVHRMPKDGLPQVAFLGPSNVGKSSLINTLLGHAGTARVSKTPGRTQLLNLFRINGRMSFVDLPGYGYAKVPRDVQANFQRMVGEYLAASESLVLLVLLLDSRRAPSPADLELRGWLVSGRVPHVIVVTKADKLKAGELARQVQLIRTAMSGGSEPVVVQTVSATTGLGKRELWQVIDAHVALVG